MLTEKYSFKLVDWFGNIKMTCPILYQSIERAMQEARLAHAHFVFNNNERVKIRFEDHLIRCAESRDENLTLQLGCTI